MLAYTLKELIRYNVHLGHYYWECNNLLGYFLLGTRNLINIINIYNTIYNLKKMLYIVYNLGVIRQRILVANNINYPIKSYLHKLNKNFIHINKKWTGGLLTNQKDLYTYNRKLFLKFYELGYRSILPAFVFVTNIENNSSCIFEAMVLDIINGSLFDTNLNYYGIFYKICSNDENFAIMAYLIRIIAKIYIKSTYINMKILLLKKSNLKILKKKKINKIKKWKIWKKWHKDYYNPENKKKRKIYSQKQKEFFKEYHKKKAQNKKKNLFITEKHKNKKKNGKIFRSIW